MKRIITIISLCFLVLQGVKSSYFKNYQVENGLAHNSVWTVMQDSKGFMWFGTNDGLNRFDGKHFKVYRKKQNDSLSIGHNFIHCIKEDSKNRMLIGTRRGLYRYNREDDNFNHILLKQNDDNYVNVNDIMEDLQGNIWIASHGQGLFQLDPDLKIKKHYIFSDTPGSIPSNYIWTMITDHYGNLWLGTAGNGLVHFDPRNERFTSIYRKSLDVSKQSIYSIYCDNDNNLWIGTFTNGLFKYNYINDEGAHYLQNIGSIKSINEYSAHELIMGSDKGLIVFNKLTGTHTIIKDESSAENVADNSIFSIARDNEGSFWIGTYFGGVNYFAPNINKFLHFNSLHEKTTQKYIISSLVEKKDGNILMATHNNNIIYQFNPKAKTLEKAFEMDYHNIQSLYLDNDRLYLSIYGRGIKVISIHDGRMIEQIRLNTIEGKSIFKMSDGSLIFALEEGGCAVMKPGGKLKRIENLAGLLVVDISEDSDGTIWFATHAYGLFCLQPDGKWKTFSINSEKGSSLASNTLSCIMCDKNNRVWIGTKDEGVMLVNASRGKLEKIFNKKNGMPSNTIYSLLNDKEGNMWVSTRKGIVRISHNNLNEIKFFGYIGKEIQCNSKCALRSSANDLYFGEANGFITLNPDELIVNTNIPPVAITGFRIFNKEVIPGEKSSPLKSPLENTTEITLESNQSNFSFDFVSLSYVSPENNEYAYILEGFDKTWNYVTDNTAQYMNIPPGKYVFRVKGTNNDGVWSDKDTSITIRIKPPFWLEYYMIILYILLIAGIIYYIVRRYQNYLIAQNQEKHYKYQVAKEKEMYESKISFFTNIAHEIRTPLSLITGPLEAIILSEDGNEQTQKNLGSIKRNANRLLDLVNQLLDFRKIENDMFLLNIRRYNISQIVQKVYNQYQQDAQRQNIEMTMEKKDVIIGDVDSESLYKIVSNLLSNAIKFTKTRVEIKLLADNDMICLSVKDDGNGINENYQNKIFEPFYQVQVTDNYNNKGSGLGLSLSKSLARKHGGDISVQSENEKGSIFTLTIPVNKSSEKPIEVIETPELPIHDPLELTEPESGQTILVVEDNNELRTFIKECLATSYTIVEAENGVKALQIIENNTIDIIISDILMPEMDGLELCNRIKGNMAYSHLPVILLSAKTDTVTKIEGLKKGADVYMEKPFSIEQLKAQIASIFENRNNLRKKFIESPLQYYKQNSEGNENADFIKKLNRFILENMSSANFSIDNMASEFAISRTNFHNKIKSITGVTPNEYIKLIRLNKSAELLATGKYRINEVCFIVGFNSSSYFAKCFYEQFGKLPKDFTQN